MSQPETRSADSILRDAIAQQGWDEQSVVDMLTEYIENQGSNEAFADFIDEKIEAEGGGTAWLNHYQHDDCNVEWTDVWSCQVNDTCPACGTKEIEPYLSQEIPWSGGIA